MHPVMYLKTEQGQALTLLIVTGSSIAISESCEMIAARNEITEALEEVIEGGHYLKGPGMNCNAQQHPYEGEDDE